MSLDGLTAIVTGGARGIGSAIAATLAEDRAHVVIADRIPADTLVETIRSGGGSACAQTLDITDHRAVEAMVQTVEREIGPVLILVNNAGILTRGTILELTHEDWHRVMSVNVNGTFNCCKSVIPAMVEHRRGSIVNITSVAGKTGDITAAPAYGTSKGAINALTKSLARQLAPYGIRVNAVAPHAIETDMSAEWSAKRRREIIEEIPLRCLGSPQDVAEAVRFLVSERSRFITGEILDVNGGYLMD